MLFQNTIGKVIVFKLCRHFAKAGQHFHERACAAHFCHLAHLFQKVVKIKLALFEFCGHFGGVFLFNCFGGFFNQGNNITHAENTARDTVRKERFNFVPLFTSPHQLNRLAGNGLHRHGATTAGIPVNTGHHDAGNAHFFVKFLRDIDGILSRHGINHQKGFGRLCQFGNASNFVHQFLVNCQAPGCVEHEDIKTAKTGFFHRAFGDLDRRLAFNNLKRRNACLFPQNSQLVLRRWTVDIKRSHQHFFLVLVCQVFGYFCGRGGFTGTLQAHHQERGRGGGIDIEVLNIFATEHFDHGIMDNFNDLLSGLNGFDDFGANRTFFYDFNELFDDGQGDIGLEQRHTDLAGGGVDVILAQAAFTAQLVKNTA